MIEARGLVKRYRSTLAVDDLSFDVRPGTVTGFLGPNGAGKSTTMRMIMGLDRPDAGQVTVGGRRYADLRWPLREVGALLEAKAFHPGRTARAHLTALAASNAIARRRVTRCSPSPASSRPRTAARGSSRWACPSAWASPPPCSAIPGCCCSTNRSTAWTRRASAGSATCCAAWPPRAGRCWSPAHLISEIAHTADALIVIGRGRLLAQTTVARLSARGGSLEEAFFQLTGGVTDYSGELS